MTPEDLMAKAARAAESARVLLDAGDADGACNRAYYAIFDAARAALMASGHAVGKTHKGVISAFSEHLIRSGPLPKELGRLLKRAEIFRYVADYGGDPVEASDALEMVRHAEVVVSAVRADVVSPTPSADDAVELPAPGES